MEREKKIKEQKLVVNSFLKELEIITKKNYPDTFGEFKKQLNKYIKMLREKN